jgi:anti-sigma factor ChrR (cupin superfamily)
MSLRALAKLIDVSPSFVSQVELGKASPSVGTLYALVTALGLSLDDVMPEDGAAEPEPARPATPEPGNDSVVAWPRNRAHVQRGGTRRHIKMAGVTWERLTPDDDPFVDFLYVTYQPGSASCPDDDLMRHGGREYGHVVSGRLAVQVGFESYELDPGDSINFDSATPHRLSNPFDEPAVAVWVVVDRRGDNRVAPMTNWESAHLPALL